MPGVPLPREGNPLFLPAAPLLLPSCLRPGAVDILPDTHGGSATRPVRGRRPGPLHLPAGDPPPPGRVRAGPALRLSPLLPPPPGRRTRDLPRSPRLPRARLRPGARDRPRPPRVALLRLPRALPRRPPPRRPPAHRPRGGARARRPRAHGPRSPRDRGRGGEALPGEREPRRLLLPGPEHPLLRRARLRRRGGARGGGEGGRQPRPRARPAPDGGGRELGSLPLPGSSGISALPLSSPGRPPGAGSSPGAGAREVHGRRKPVHR